MPAEVLNPLHCEGPNVLLKQNVFLNSLGKLFQGLAFTADYRFPLKKCQAGGRDDGWSAATMYVKKRQQSHYFMLTTRTGTTFEPCCISDNISHIDRKQ